MVGFLFMKQAIIFSSYVPSTDVLYKAVDILNHFVRQFNDCDIFIGINPSCFEWVDIIEHYKEQYKLNVYYKFTDNDKIIDSDASAYQTALKLYKEIGLEHELVWFSHTKGITSNSTLMSSVYKIFYDKRFEIEQLFKKNDNLGLFMPWMIKQLPINKNYVENNLKHILVGDKFKPCSDLTGHYSFYTIRGNLITQLLNDVHNDFFDKNLLELGVEQKFDRYFFERDFPMFVEKYGYETYPNDHSWSLKYE